MKRISRHKRATAAIIGAGAVAAAAVLPGSLATAETTGEVYTDITRAVLIQGDADAEVYRQTLVTQINVEGNGNATFSVPVGDGGTPKNMDTFGAPTISDGSAQYDVAVDGTEVIRTSQNYEGDIPVTMSVSATLDGQPISMTDLPGKSGLVKVSYSFENTSSEPTTLTYRDARGQRVYEEAEIPVPMGASITINYPESWGDVVAPTATTVTGNGTGETQVSATVALLPDTLPGQSVSGSFEVEANVDKAVVPPADIKVAVIPPDTNPTLKSARATGESSLSLAKSLTGAGTQIADGAGELQAGLGPAADGASQLAAGTNQLNDQVPTLESGIGQLADGGNQLEDGLQQLAANVPKLDDGIVQLANGLVDLRDKGLGELEKQAKNLPQTVTADPSFKQITDGFDTLDDLVRGVRDALGTYTDPLTGKNSGTPLTASGDINTSEATAATSLWGLTYGVRSKDIPSSSPTKTPADATGGLTNPDCDIDKPTDPTNPCGAFQILAATSEAFTNPTTGAIAALTGASAGLTTVSDGLTGLDASLAGNSSACVPATGENCSAAQVLGAVSTGLNGAINSTTEGIPAIKTGVGTLKTVSLAKGDELAVLGGVEMLALANRITSNGDGLGSCSTSLPTGWTGPKIECSGNASWQGLGADLTAITELLYAPLTGTDTPAILAAGIGSILGVTGVGGVIPNGLDGVDSGLDDTITGLVSAKTGVDGVILGLNGSSDTCDLTTGANCSASQVLAALNAGVTNPKCDTANPTDPTNPCGVKQIVDLVIGSPDPADPQGLYKAAGALTQLNGVITTNANGQPDKDTSTETTATGIIMQLRSSLAEGGTGSSGYPAGRCTAYATAGDPSSGPNPDADPDSVKETCAAADVLNLAIYASGSIENGVSTTLLEGISDTLLEGIGKYSKNCDPEKTLACAVGSLEDGGQQLEAGGETLADGVPLLVDGGTQLADGLAQLNAQTPALASGISQLNDGAQQLAEGLPTAVTGAGQLKTQGGEALEQQGNDGSKQAASAIATLDALQARADDGGGIPGGAPVGATTFGGIYSFQLDGAGGPGTGNAARLALAVLALVIAGGAGVALARRAGA